MLIVLIAKKGFGFWIRFNYSRIVYYSALPIPNLYKDNMSATRCLGAVWKTPSLRSLLIYNKSLIMLQIQSSSSGGTKIFNI